jgi:hypothetical protein
MPTEHVAAAIDYLEYTPVSAKAAVHAQLASADALDRIAEFFDRLGAEQDAERQQRIAAAEVISDRFTQVVGLFTQLAGGTWTTYEALDQVARVILGPAYEPWAADNNWNNGVTP